MALLNFKYGLLANLPATGAPGTVYVTSDERAMYVDLPTSVEGESQRIRIGDFRQYNNLAELTADISNGTPAEGLDTSKISETAFYYCVAENALLKWNKNEAKWVQINGTAQITANISNLQNAVFGTGDGTNGLVSKVGALETSVSTNATAITDITKEGGVIDTRVKALDDDLQAQIDNITKAETGAIAVAVKAEADRAAAAEKKNSDAIAANGTAISTNAQGIAANKAAIESNDADILKLQQDLAALQGTGEGSVVEQLGALKEELVGDANTKNTIMGAQKTADDAAAAATANTTSITELGTAVAQTYIKKTDAPGYGDILTKTDAGTIYATKTELANEKAALLGADVTVAGSTTIKGAYLHADAALQKATANVTSIQTAQNRADAAYELANGKIDAAGVEAYGYATVDYVDEAVAGLLGKSTDAATANTIHGAKAAAAAVQGEVDALETTVAQLASDIGKLSNVMNFVGAIDPSVTEGYETGDVGIVAADGNSAGKEYVFDGSKWVELGDVGPESARLTAVEGEVDTLNTIVGLTADAGLQKKVADNAASIGALDTAYKDADTATLKSAKGYTDDQITAHLEWGTF